MQQWQGSAGVCINAEGKMLMVLQGKPEEDKCWSVPSGGQEAGETAEQCCIRELHEETGYEVVVKQKLFDKKGDFSGFPYNVTYFEIAVVGGSPTFHDPDQLIYAIEWKSAAELAELQLGFPEDRAFLIAAASTGSIHTAAEQLVAAGGVFS